jgi:reverse gyrase 2
MNDKQIEKLALAISKKLNINIAEEKKTTDNRKKIKEIKNEIDRKKNLLQKIEKGEIKGLHINKVIYGGIHVQGGKREYKSNLEKLEDLKEKINKEILGLEHEILKLETAKKEYIESILREYLDENILGI